MSDEEVVERLAERLKWQVERLSDGCLITWYPDNITGSNMGTHSHGSPHPLLTSRDALAPILAGLSPEEQCKLDVLIWGKMWRQNDSALLRSAAWLLTLPARDLAHAIVGILEDKQ